MDHDTHAAMNLSKFIKSADDILTMCLEPILHHSSVGHYAKDIVALNGLPLLMEIYNRFKDDVNVNLTLCRIISNICSYPEVLGEIFRSGKKFVLHFFVLDNRILKELAYCFHSWLIWHTDFTVSVNFFRLDWSSRQMDEE